VNIRVHSWLKLSSGEIIVKAAVLHELGQPLAIEDAATPEPEAGELLIRVAACGVCHSDLHLAEGDWDMLKPITKLPLVLGHEVTGTVERIGAGVEGFAVGDRVGVPWLHDTCGECEFCLAGRETLCLKQKVTGCTVDGGFAEYLKAKASHTARIPDKLSFEEAAPLLCAGLTVYKSFKTSGIQPGQRLVVFGVGGLGHLAVQLGKAMGVEVGAVDVSEEKMQLARECGADWTVNAATTQAHKEIKSRGGAHVAMVTSGSRAAYETAQRALRRGGTLAVVGMSPEPISVSTVAMVSGELRIVASAVGTRDDLRELLALATEGRLRCRIETRELDDINQIFAEMKNGNIQGRVVLTL
jgi:propanol-preferring alcohol dehydrogenase